MIRTPTRCTLAAACALACATTCPGIASAQQPTDTPPAAETVELERVIATAQKRSESIMDVPMGISVIGESRLESINAGSLTDYAAYVPGFQVDSGGAPGITSIALRGMAPLGSGAIIGTYIDDSPINASGNKQRTGSYALDLLPYDVESVEILRGPQGTLYGASAMGGLLKYVTRAADPDHFEFRAGMDVNHVASAGDLGTGVRMAANVPLSEGRAGMRVSFARQATPGYVDEAGLGLDDTNDVEQLAARLAFTFNLSEAVQLRLQGLWQKVDADSVAEVGLDPATLRPERGLLDGSAALLQPYRNAIDFYSATLDWDLGWADVVSASSFVSTRLAVTQDASPSYGVAWPLFGASAGTAAFDLDLENRKFTQEIRLTSKTGDRLDWLVGAFYTDEDNDNAQSVLGWDGDGDALPFNPAAVIALPNTYEETAAFADVTWKLSPRFDVSGGARVARNTQWYNQLTTGALVGEADEVGDSNETVRTWKLASRWHLDPDAMLYARVATGYRAGGPNLALPGVPSMVASDTSRNYELGFKTQFWQRRAMLDVALFRIDWSGLQVGAVTDTGLNYLDNAGDARSEGAELSFLLQAAQGLTWGVNAAYTDSAIGDQVPAESGLTPGGRMPLTPRRSWSTTLDYDFDVTAGWRGKVGGGYRYTGDRTGLNGYPIEAYESVDLHAELSNMTWTWRLYVRNATDEQSYLSISEWPSALTGEVAQLRGVPLQPRTIGVSFDYRF
ncbi:TonB-dependent receptor [Luteimonas sp. FCS-9]|uniref:TonB-dependent receptor n=1 Tax=Luteimonas sp. FCS-9 TaxID=1547516 RepID=UPI000B1389D3|nr:TonB-dependent receptor [Luteimonas sp. FCS-9]